MRLFKTKFFSKWAKQEGLADASLCSAAQEMNNGLFDAVLGGGVFKKRIARQGQGKRGGYRTIVAFKTKERCFFLYGFAKNETENINQQEKKALKKLAKELLGYTHNAIGKAIKSGALTEVTCHEQK